MFGTLMMMSGKPVVNKSIIISANKENYNLINDGFGGVAPTSRTAVTITVNSGIYVYSDDAALPAMNLTGLPDESTIQLTNLGYIIGGGGDGGDGMSVETESGA